MTGVSTIGQSLSQIARFNDLQFQVDKLSTQLATGKITQKFSGLKTEALTSQRSRAEYATLQRYIDNAAAADRRIKLTVDALAEFKEQANNLSDALLSLSQQSVHQQGEEVKYDNPLTADVDESTVGMSSATPDTDLKNLQAMATNLFDFLGSLLNAKDGDRYLLGGAETALKPFSDNGLLDSAVNGLISDWKNEAAATNISSAKLVGALRESDSSVDSRAITDSIAGFNASLSAGNTGEIYIRVDDAVEINYTARANESPLRDIMVIASFLSNENLTPMADTYVEPNAPPNAPDVQGAPGATLEEQMENFFAVLNGVAETLDRAISDIDEMTYRLESARARVNDIQERHQESQNLLLSLVSDVEDIDMNEAAVQINLLQIQLDASYRVASRVQQLSLVNFL